MKPLALVIICIVAGLALALVVFLIIAFTDVRH
jgi:hypothetical protein